MLVELAVAEQRYWAVLEVLDIAAHGAGARYGESLMGPAVELAVTPSWSGKTLSGWNRAYHPIQLKDSQE